MDKLLIDLKTGDYEFRIDGKVIIVPSLQAFRYKDGNIWNLARAQAARLREEE